MKTMSKSKLLAPTSKQLKITVRTALEPSCMQKNKERHQAVTATESFNNDKSDQDECERLRGLICLHADANKTAKQKGWSSRSSCHDDTLTATLT